MDRDEYHEKFEIVLTYVSNGNDDLKRMLKKYLQHCKQYGRQAANNVYPECKKLTIDNKEVKKSWNKIIRILDGLKK
jgi:hypothetical protein